VQGTCIRLTLSQSTIGISLCICLQLRYYSSSEFPCSFKGEIDLLTVLTISVVTLQDVSEHSGTLATPSVSAEEPRLSFTEAGNQSLVMVGSGSRSQHNKSVEKFRKILIVADQRTWELQAETLEDALTWESQLKKVWTPPGSR